MFSGLDNRSVNNALFWLEADSKESFSVRYERETDINTFSFIALPIIACYAGTLIYMPAYLSLFENLTL